MKILMVNKFLYPNGGSETYIFETGRMLENLGHEVQYFGMEHEGRIVGNRIDCYTRNMDFHHASVAEKLQYPTQIIYSKEAAEKITKVLEDFRPDVVHFNNINFQLTPSVIEAVHKFDPKIRMVYTAHDSQWVCPNHMLKIPSTGALCKACIDGDFSACMKNRCIHNSRLRSFLGKKEGEFYRKRGTYALIDTVICPSRFMEKVLSHNPDLRGKTLVLHNFLPEEMRREQEKRKSAPSREQERARKTYVLYLGRYDYEKGISSALKAAESLPEIPFVFAGKGKLEEKVQEAAGRCSNIENLGFLSGEVLQKTLQNAAFMIFPSESYENCPFSVVESQISGTPVLASDLGGTPELILSGMTGEVIPSKRVTGQGNQTSGAAKVLKDAIASLWRDEDRLCRYQNACRSFAGAPSEKLGILTLREYCEKLLSIYRGDRNGTGNDIDAHL